MFAVRIVVSVECGKHTDDLLPGFGVRVSCGGVKAFVLVYGRARKRVTLGRYPAIGLADARDKAKELLAERTLGKQETPPIKFEDAVELFLKTRYPGGYPRRRHIEDLTVKKSTPSKIRGAGLA